MWILRAWLKRKLAEQPGGTCLVVSKKHSWRLGKRAGVWYPEEASRLQAARPDWSDATDSQPCSVTAHPSSEGGESRRRASGAWSPSLFQSGTSRPRVPPFPPPFPGGCCRCSPAVCLGRSCGGGRSRQHGGGGSPGVRDGGMQQRSQAAVPHLHQAGHPGILLLLAGKSPLLGAPFARQRAGRRKASAAEVPPTGAWSERGPGRASPPSCRFGDWGFRDAGHARAWGYVWRLLPC